MNGKELILSQISEYDIFRHYIGSGFKLGVAMTSPLREERHPSFNVYRNKSGKMYYKDFGEGNENNGDCFDFVKRLYNVEFSEAIDIIKNDFGIEKSYKYQRKSGAGLFIKDKKEEPVLEENEPIVFDVNFYDNIQYEKSSIINFFISYIWFGKYVFLETLLNLNKLRFIQSVKFTSRKGYNINIESTEQSPIFMYNYNNDKKRFYRPFEKKMKHFGNIPGNEFFLQDMLEDYLKDKNMRDKILIITGGQKDAIVLNSYFDKLAFSTCVGSESSNINYEYINNLLAEGMIKSENIIIFYDDDQVGEKNAVKISRMLNCKYIGWGEFKRIYKLQLKAIINHQCDDNIDLLIAAIDDCKDISKICELTLNMLNYLSSDEIKTFMYRYNILLFDCLFNKQTLKQASI